MLYLPPVISQVDGVYRLPVICRSPASGLLPVLLRLSISQPAGYISSLSSALRKESIRILSPHPGVLASIVCMSVCVLHPVHHPRLLSCCISRLHLVHYLFSIPCVPARWCPGVPSLVSAVICVARWRLSPAILVHVWRLHHMPYLRRPAKIFLHLLLILRPLGVII